MSRRRNIEAVPLMDKDDDWKEQDLEDLVLNDILDNIKHYPQVVSYRQLWKSIILISLASSVLGIITSYYLYNVFNANNSMVQVAKKNVYMHMKENLYEAINHKNIEEHHRILQKTGNEELLSYIKSNWIKEGLDTVNIMSYNFLTSSSEGRSEQLSIIESSQNNSEGAKDEKNQFYEAKCIYCDCPFIKDQIAIGDLVYANYARFSDFLQLQELNINVSKKIIISQIGEIPIITFIAKEFGAAGLILFPYQGILNASINSSAAKDDQVHAGHCSELLHIKEISYGEDGQLKTSFQMIPVFLISFEDATNFLRKMVGPKFPDNWIINDTFPYKLGPGFENKNKIKLEIKIKNDRNQTDYIIIGKIFGGRETDRSVMIGMSKQFGQLRGISTLLEIVRIFGNSLKNGRRPKRNILFCIWGFSDIESFSFYKWIIENHKKLEGELVSYIDVSSLKSPKIISSPLLYEKVLNIVNKISKINKITKEKNSRWLKRINDDIPENCVEGNSFDPLYFKFGIPTIHFKFNWNLYNVISGQILLEAIQSLSDDSVLSFTYEEYISYFKNATYYLEKQYKSFFKENGIALNSLELAIKEFFQVEEVFMKNLRVNSENSDEIRSINDILMKTERAMISFNNFPLRNDYRHILFGTNISNICNIISFPGIDNLYFESKIKPGKPLQDDITKHIATIEFHIESLTKILHGSL
ncbi:N-acetylated-alpha-linked acidic dipeptidase 2-like [Centruroides vittatus]|uniref:N-acetylated-alpha-linked acidic dipeptidase 2-like n=1 Tax=Centruroides vittatus TaxID=120091 RepID=UPI00350FA780